MPSVKTISREIMHTKFLHAADTCQSLAYVIDSAHQRLCSSCHFSVAILQLKAFETATIEDDGGTKTATISALSDKILCNLLDRSGTATCATCRSLVLQKVDSKPTT